MLDEVLLKDREFLVGDRFTVADICVSYALYLGQDITVDGKKLSDSYKPQTFDYMKRMSSREGFLSAQRIQEQSSKLFKQKHP